MVSESDAFIDHYAVLAVARDAGGREIRRAFRARVLEVHPDKAPRPVDPARLRLVMRAFEVLSDDDLRENYDRALELWERAEAPESNVPHITENERPVGRARAILYLLLNERTEEAMDRLRFLEEEPVHFLGEHLDHGEFVDAAFLIAEDFQKRKLHTEALHWLQEIVNRESGRRKQRPCYPEVLEQTKKILIQRLQDAKLEPRVSLEYLRRAEDLGLTRPERVEVYKKRAQCYLEMDMLVEAAKQLHKAMELQPNLKGATRLQEALEDYL